MRQFYFIPSAQKTVYSINSYPISLVGRARYKVNKEVQNVEHVAEFKYVIALRQRYNNVDVTVPSSVGDASSRVNFNPIFLKVLKELAILISIVYCSSVEVLSIWLRIYYIIKYEDPFMVA